MAVPRNLLIALILASTVWSAETSSAEARRLFLAAEWSEKKGDTLNAFLLYARASALDPGNVEYTFHKNALEAKAMLTAETRLEADPVLDFEPEPGQDAASLLALGEMSPAEISEAREALPVTHLVDPGTRKSFDLVRSESRAAIEKVTAEYGIQAVFDPEYQAPPPFNFRLQELSMLEALRALEIVSNSLMVPVGEHGVVVFRDNPQRRGDAMPTMAIAIPIPDRLTMQEAQEILAAVQQTVELKKVAVDPGRHMIYVRDQVTKVLAAKELIARLSRARPQVEVEVELLSVSKNSSLGYGLNLQSQSALVNFGGFLNNTPSFLGGFAKFLALGGGTSLIGIGVADAAAMATLTRASATSALRAQVATVDGQPATLHVGDRYPIITNGYFGPTTGTGAVYAPPPTVQFQDLGLTLKVTPSVHDGGEVTLDVEAQYSVLGAGSSNGIPVISNRKFTGKLRLMAGEWAVVAGLAEATSSTSYTGPWTNLHIPFFGRLFGTNNISKDSNEVLIVLKPRLTNVPPWEYPIPTLLVGTEANPLSLF